MSTSHYRERVVTGGRCRKRRAKTFDSAEKAQDWAKANKMENCSTLRMRSGLSKKFKIVQE